MKLKSAIMMLSIGMLLLGCNSKKDPAPEESPGEISGMVREGYRHLDLRLTGEPEMITVYRGDYIKFFLDDDGAPESEYQLNIPDLQISTMIKDNTEDQPYFKMKEAGRFQFRVGERLGEIRVVELRQSNYAEVSAEEAWNLLRKNPPLLLDVRTENEFNTGHLKDAKLIPLQELQGRLGELDIYRNQPILVYCATGNRSTTAAKILLDRGYKDVKNLRMGIVGWASKGYNVEFR